MKIPNFNQARILVVGDVMLDRYWQGSSDRVSPESPVPVVDVRDCFDRPGGAANVAMNIAALEGNVDLLGVVGQDEFGSSLRDALSHRLISTNLIESSDVSTITKLRILSRHQQMLRLDFGSKMPDSVQTSLQSDYESLLKGNKVVVLSDYGKGTLNGRARLIDLAKRERALILVDPKGQDFAYYEGVDLLTPNRKEFEKVMGECADEAELYSKAKEALIRYNLSALLITRSDEGMTLFRCSEEPLHLTVHSKEVFDVTGAGDTVIATIAAALSIGETLENAVHYSNLAASLVVSKMGTSTVPAAEFRLEWGKLYGYDKGVIDEVHLLELVQDAKKQGKNIVMTNGCFDILHVGHVHYLKEAKAKGDYLIVAVNVDESVKQLKGPKRPINSLKERMDLLAGLECVDWVVPFSELTPLNIIQKINPDTLVKGSDYDITEVVGADYVLSNGGRVELIDYVEGFSTSAILQNIAKEST